jgi:hypothetical protein
MGAGHEVLMEVGNNILLIVGNPCTILDHQLIPRSIQLLNVFILLMEQHILDTNAGKQLS